MMMNGSGCPVTTEERSSMLVSELPLRIKVHQLLEGAAQARGVAVIIDVFRAFTTACYAIEAKARDYLLVGNSDDAERLRIGVSSPFLIGKAELGAELTYDIPNSPSRLLEHVLAGRTIIHRTGAGARGVLCAGMADELLTGSLVNVSAIVRYLHQRRPPVVSLVCMGHEGGTPTLEDEICARAIAARLQGESFDLKPFVDELRYGTGKYFFGDTQDEYPREDFARCLEEDRFAFVLKVERCGSYARLKRLDV